jgi:EAL domain-containing protein (putative c-di-GMP-specific phosphodiesterase class I)
VAFALDRFGASCISFERLRQLPLDRVTVDDAILARAGHDEVCRAFVESVDRLMRLMKASRAPLAGK